MESLVRRIVLVTNVCLIIETRQLVGGIELIGNSLLCEKYICNNSIQSSFKLIGKSIPILGKYIFKEIVMIKG